MRRPWNAGRPSWPEWDYWHTMLPCTGTRKLSAKLRTEGYEVGRKLVRVLMREMEICAVYPKPNLSKHNFKEKLCHICCETRQIFESEF